MTKRELDFGALLRSNELAPQDAAAQYINAGFKVAATTPMGKAPMDFVFGETAQAVLESPISRWMDRPSPNVALLTGDGFWVLDVDGEMGAKSLEWLASVADIHTPSAVVKSGNGWHLYYRCHEDEKMPTSVGILPGIDIRGLNSCIVAPGSIHASGNRYNARTSVKLGVCGGDEMGRLLRTVDIKYDTYSGMASRKLREFAQLARHSVVPRAECLETKAPATSTTKKGKAPAKKGKAPAKHPIIGEYVTNQHSTDSTGPKMVSSSPTSSSPTPTTWASEI